MHEGGCVLINFIYEKKWQAGFGSWAIVYQPFYRGKDLLHVVVVRIALTKVCAVLDRGADGKN